MASVKKIRKADKSYGRGRDNVYYPAWYGVFNDSGIEVAKVRPERAIGYMEKAEWICEWTDTEGKYNVKHFWFGGFKDAKKWAEDNF